MQLVLVLLVIVPLVLVQLALAIFVVKTIFQVTDFMYDKIEATIVRVFRKNLISANVIRTNIIRVKVISYQSRQDECVEKMSLQQL